MRKEVKYLGQSEENPDNNNQKNNENNNENNQENNSQKLQMDVAKKTVKGIGTIIATLVTSLATLLAPFLPFIILAVVVGSAILDFATEIFTAKDTPSAIMEGFEVENLTDLVEIKEDGQGGYYYGFVDGFDEKIEKVNKKMNSTTGVHNMPNSSEFLKKIIKAELVTQYPDLGGKIPDGSDGFQGSIKIRRATPDKQIEEMKNTGVEDSIPVVQDDVLDPGGTGKYEEMVKSWSAGQKVTIRVTAKVYEQAESKLNPGSDTGYWEEVIDETGRVKTIPKGTEVEYTGTYKNNTNPLTGDIITYVEIKNGDETVYVRANYLTDNSSKNSSKGSNESKDSEEARATSVAKVTSRARGDSEKIKGDKDSYVVAIAAGRNTSDDPGASSGDLIEEDLTIEVAEKVQELLEERFSNITVVQTGSTSSNRDGVSPEDRVQLAKDAKPDLCIQIYFNSSTDANENGVEVIYQDGDSISEQLAEILSNSISSEMGLTNRGAGTDTDKSGGNLVIIENAATSGFPSVVTEGGFLSGNVDADVIKNGGVDKYAEGIVEGIKEYLEADHSGYTSVATEDKTITQGISSVIRNLKYVPQETFEQYIADGNTEALKVYTLDDEYNLITATWSSSNGSITIKKNSAMNLETILQTYILPYEYLLFFYIDTDYEEFSEELADTIINDTEIVIALQDNVTTTQTTTTTEQQRVDENGKITSSGSSGSSSDKNEICNTSIDITYVKTWCVKSYQENSYSSEVLDMGDQDSKVVTIKGKVEENHQSTSSNWTTTGTEKSGEKTYLEQQRTTTDVWTISNRYESGEMTTEGNESTFVKLYNKHNMYRRVRADYLFDIIEQNERTSNLLDLTKYLMFKATNINYGVIEFDFSMFSIERFNQVSSTGGLDLLTEYIHYWEHSSPPPTNADGTKYIIENDGAGNAVVGYGVDIFNGGFADEFAAAGQPTNIGGEVDKDFVDGLEKQEIQSCLDSVRSMTSGLNLKEYQIYALVSRAYNCGVGGAITTKRGSPSMNFVDSYNAYWTDADDQFEAKNPNANFNHSLYTQYMSKPVTASGSYLAGLERRRKSEWTLFQTGYFDVLDKWYAEGGNLLAVADELHKAQQTWTYSTGGDLFWNNIEMSINNPNQVTCCATYVSSVIYKAGYFTEEQMNSFNYNSATALHNFLANNGWQSINSYAELQPGDVVFMTSGSASGIGHVQLYAGDGTWYNAGSTSAIQRPSPYESDASARFIVAMRAS